MLYNTTNFSNNSKVTNNSNIDQKINNISTIINNITGTIVTSSVNNVLETNTEENTSVSASDTNSTVELIACSIILGMIFCFCWSNYEKANRQLEEEKAENYRERQRQRWKELNPNCSTIV